MRILIVTHAPLSAEFGASQIALNLGEALLAHGHDVTVWSPQPLPENIRWWRTIRAMRARLDEFLRSTEAFDVIDCPPTLVTHLVSQSAVVFARSAQPDLRYLWISLTRRRIGEFKALYLPFEFFHTLYHSSLVLRGWARARRIMCLGNLELVWMRRWFPWWRGKLESYVVAPSADDQVALTEVRKARIPPNQASLRFLWIGRWVAHKGRKQLLDFIERWHAVRPNDTFTIAGCGPVPEGDCPIKLLRSGVVTLVPSFERDELGGLLASHEIGLFTSSVEGWGLSLNEMLESGMVVYATPAGGVSDLRPYFRTLFAFPPKPEEIVAERDTNPVKNYYDTFSWPSIAKTYESSFPRGEGKFPERVPENLTQHNEAST